jgi:hypothetical protein
MGCGARREYDAGVEIRRVPKHTVFAHGRGAQGGCIVALCRSFRLLGLCPILVAVGLVCAQAAAQNHDDFRLEIGRLIDQLGSDDWVQRDAATSELVGRGEVIAELLGTRLADEPDPEMRHRLRYILGNISPPQLAVLLISAEPESQLQPGDVITHVNGRVVSNERDLRRRVAGAGLGAMLRVRRWDGMLELGPVVNDQIIAIQDYVAPRGQGFARAARLFATGYAERAYDELATLEAEAPITTTEFPPSLRACIALAAGFGARAQELMVGYENDARVADPGDHWNGASTLDRLMGAKAPFHLEWVLFTQGGEAFQQHEADRDLRLQRILVPALRYVDSVARAFEIWWRQLRDVVAKDPRLQHVTGNTLAEAGWMLYELGLRSECCRMIEPRSAILRIDPRNPKKWVRVDTDAWLPYLAGDEHGAVDSFYPHALEVLANPPHPGAVSAVIRNPDVAARIAFFLYQLPGDNRIDELLDFVARESHPILRSYTEWMLRALDERNQKMIRRDLARVLPVLGREEALTAAKAVSLLEYVQSRPDAELLRAARERAFQCELGRERDLWVAILSAIERLAADQPRAALRELQPWEDAAETQALRHTAAFRAETPATASNLEDLAAPLLAVPMGAEDRHWLILARDHRLLLFDALEGRTQPVERPTSSWFPNPLAWPWIGRDEASGRVWVYAPQRVIEVRTDNAAGLRLNITTECIADFDRAAGPVFDELAQLVAEDGPVVGEESGEFLRAEVLEHAEMVSDPDLYEAVLMRELPRNPAIVHVALRGGPQLLAEPRSGRVWSDRWMAKQLGLPDKLRFFAQAVPAENDSAAALVWLFSDQGLIRFDTASESLERFPLPGDEPYQPVIPEWLPYQRNDPRFVYCARLPQDGGQVFRVRLADAQVEALDMINESLPAEYYQLMSRSEIRAQLDRRFTQAGMLDLNGLIDDVKALVDTIVDSATE